jgi:hypothetical protein
MATKNAPATITPEAAAANVGSAFSVMPEGLTPEQQTAFKGVQQAFSMPSKSADGAVSSSDVTTGSNATTALGAAGAAIGGGSGMPDWAKQILDSNNKMLASGQKALKLSFDSALASQSDQYASLFQELNQQHGTAKQAGAALAAQLNPYSDPRIASTTGGYLQTIDDRYQGQARKLQSQMDAAQKALQAGFYENYVNLVNSAQKENNKFVMDMQNYQLSVMNSLKQDQQFKMTYDLSKETKATDDFRSYLTTLSGSPALQADVAEFQKTGKISEGLQPIIQRGVDAGMSASEAISIFQYQTDAVRKQEALENYRANQLALSQQRVAISQANYYDKLTSQIPVPGQIVQAGSGAPVKLTDTQSQFFSMGQHLQSQAQKVKTLLQQLPTGAVKGWVTEQGKFVPVVQNKNDPKQYELLQNMADLNNMYIYFSTGKQLNESEYNRLSNQLPNTKATPEYNISALDTFTSSISERMNGYLNVNGWQIYGASNKAPATAPVTSGAQSILSKYGIPL